MESVATAPMFAQAETATWWIAGAAIAFLAVACFWLIRRDRPPQADTVPVVDLQSRVDQAEERADHAEAVVKSGLLPHLARLLRAKLVVGLVQQRRELVDAQETGATKVADLEQRLATAHNDLKEKMASYERRLAELDSVPPTAAPRQPASGPLPPAPPSALPAPPEAPRRSPLLPPSAPRPEPQPLRFHEVLAKKNLPPAPPQDAAKQPPAATEPSPAPEKPEAS